MDSNEEYLDQLLKSLTEGDSSAAGKDGDSDQDDGLGDLLNQFSDEMESVPEDLLSGLLGGAESVAEEMSDGDQVSLTDMLQDMGKEETEEPVREENPVGEPEEPVREKNLMEEPEKSALSENLMEEPEKSALSENLMEKPEESVQIETPTGEPENFIQSDNMLPEELEETALMEEPDEDQLSGSVSEMPELSGPETIEQPVPEMSEQYSSDMGDDDLGSLLESLGADGDEDAQEISELLDKADRNEPIDDMVDTLMQGLNGELTQDGKYSEEGTAGADGTEEAAKKTGRKKKKERVKKEKKPRQSKKKRRGQDADNPPEDAVFGVTENPVGEESAQQDAGEGMPSEAAGGEKKQGFWGKLLNALTQDEESEEDPADLVSDENGAILEQLDQEKKNKSKGKKKKKGKDKKSAGAEGDDEFDEDAPDEKQKKKKKEKKPKKEKPPVPVEETLPGRKLSLKKVLPIVVVALVFCLAYVLVSHLYIDYVNKQRAESAYYAGDYMECYTLLFGQNLNESQASMYHRSELILQMERMKGNYRRLVMEGKELEALDYLVQCIFRRDEVYLQGQEWNSLDVVEETYADMTGLLTANYGLTEEQAVEIAALESDVDYTMTLIGVLDGIYGSGTADEETGQQEPVDFYEDFLPEEEENTDTEFIDTIQQTEQS